jgi:hypothetical protein
MVRMLINVRIALFLCWMTSIVCWGALYLNVFFIRETNLAGVPLPFMANVLRHNIWMRFAPPIVFSILIVIQRKAQRRHSAQRRALVISMFIASFVLAAIVILACVIPWVPRKL